MKWFENSPPKALILPGPYIKSLTLEGLNKYISHRFGGLKSPQSSHVLVASDS
jgi:hypothetical protein